MEIEQTYTVTLRQSGDRVHTVITTSTGIGLILNWLNDYESITISANIREERAS